MEDSRHFDSHETRVLGVLLEKEQTTPDSYPLTINAVIQGCNQKTNRDPVCEMTETQVVEALDRLRAEVLAWRSVGPRSEKWEQSVTRRWHLVPRRKALLTLLLLRGPQTPGELKSRGERMASFESVAQVEETLAEMAEGPEALVSELPRVPGQRGRRWTHLLASDEETLVELPTDTASNSTVAEELDGRSPELAAPGQTAMARLQALETQVEGMAAEIERLGAIVAQLHADLGVE
jgi:uncharacterized protein YceH (UPF0502 family)